MIKYGVWGEFYVSQTFSFHSGDVFVVKADPVFELLATNNVGEVLLATPALTEKMPIVRGQNSVFTFENK